MSGGRTNIGGVEIDIRADGTLLIADLKRAEAQALAFSNKASSGAKKAVQEGFNPMGRAVGDVRTQMIALASVGALVGLTREAIKAADAFTGMRSRLSLVVSENENLLEVEERLAQLALKNRADLGATVSLYARLRTARKDLSDATTTKILDAWSKTLVISGANATEAASATLQFAQAMGSGRLQGAELTAVLENNSRASRLIAEGMGVSIGALKKLGEQGDLTTDKLIDIFTHAGALDAEFGKMSMTVGQAGTNLETAFTRVIGLMDQSTGITRTLAGWIDSLASSLIDLATSFGGPIAEADAALKNMSAAQNQIVEDTKALTGLQDKLREAIESQGPAAISAATAEINAVNTRIAKNRELLGVYRAQALLKIQQAQDDLATKTKPGGELDRLLFFAPQTAPGRLTFPNGTKSELRPGASPADVYGRQEDIFGNINPNNPSVGDIRFGNRAAQQQAAFDQIDNSLAKGIPLTDIQRRLNEYRGNKAEAEKKLADAEEFLNSIDIAVSGGTTVEIPGGADAGPVASSGGAQEKADKLRKYTTAIEDFNEAIKTAVLAKAADADKSRAAVQALLDYYAVTQNIEDALMRIQALTEAGLLTPADSDVIANLVQTADFQNTDFGLDTEDPSTSLAPSFDPFAPDAQDQKDYFDGYAQNIKDATAYGLKEAMLTGDWGQQFANVLEGAANDAFSRAVDKLTDALFEALASIDWGEIFGGGGGSGGVGDFLNSVFSSFGGAKAGGGEMRGGTAYRVGELGPEMFVPSTDGYMIPSRFGAVVGAPDGSGASNISVGGPTIIINGNADGVTVRQLEAVLEQHRRTLPDMIDARVINRIGRGAY